MAFGIRAESVWPDRVIGKKSPAPKAVLESAVKALEESGAPYQARVEPCAGENGGSSFRLSLFQGPKEIDVASLLVPAHGGYPATVAFTQSDGLNRYLRVLDADQLILALREAVNRAVD